jgi:hypothetical protein
MNRDDVDRLLAQAVREAEPNELYKYRFAALVAAEEREACAKVVEQAGVDGYGTLAAALLVRERGAP